ncbi:hypothetical protein M569_01364 [Genlisea aurea]|uniref:CMP/dCMP-type deaminase domain-containing protein n=1 Tax=Genlisea aurea TaxID=192259 RepID=S8ELA4_9LAMI|nr:hypothetical protein M569_01364 [Genlisea aurea]
MVFGSFDPCFLARVSAFDVGSSRSCCCDEVRCFSEKSGSRRKERLRKFVVLEERSKRYSDEFIDEAEAVLSLLTDEVDDEYLRVSAKARRAAKKNIQNEIRNTKVSSTVRSKKMMGSYLDILEDESASSHDSDSLHSSEIESNMGKEKVCKNRGRHALLPEENRRAILKKRNNRTLLTSGIIASQKEEKDVPLRKLSRKSEEQHAEEKKSLMENLKVEDVSKKLKNDESSCSSYHSFASSGNYESDNEVEHRQEEYVKSSTGHERNSSGEIVKKQVMHEDHRVGEHGISMKKSSSSVVSNFIESDFRKKSEKKLTEASVEEMESMKRNSRKESKFLEHKHYEKSSDCNVDYDDQKKNSSLDMKLDEETKQQHYKQASDEGSMESETRLKYKNHMDGQGIHYGDPKISYGSKESMYRVKSDAFPKIATSNLETGGKSQSVVGIATRNELNQSSSSTQVAKASKSDVKKTSISLQSSETAISGDNYTISLPSKNDDEKLQPRFEQVHGTEVPGGVSQQVIRIENNSVVKQSNQIIKQEENVSLSYGSTVESEKKPHSGRAHDKISEPVDHSFGSDEAKRISITLSGAVDVHHTVDKNVKETEASSVDVLNEGQWRFPQNVVSHASGDSQTKEHDSKGDDWFSRAAEGPSDEMWKLYEPSTTDSRQQKEVIRDDETEAGTELVKGHDDETRAGAEIVKRNGRSLWNIVGDIFRLRWSPRSGSHHSGRKTGGSPQTQSTGSEPWFSSHEAEENEEASRNGRSTVKKTSPHGHRKERSVFQVEEKSSSSASEKLEGGLQATTISPAITATTSSSGEETSGVTPSVAAIDSSTTSPVLRPQEPLFVSMDHRSESTVSQGKSKGRMLQRKDQLQRGDRFAEWEEAYRLEAEQRKIDETFMREAISEAQKAGDNWEVPVGAVLVHDGKIIARGCNQ